MARTPGKSRNYRERRGRWTVLVTRPSTIFLPPRHTTFTAFGASTQATATDAGHRAHVVATTFQATIEAAVVLDSKAPRRLGSRGRFLLISIFSAMPMPI